MVGIGHGDLGRHVYQLLLKCCFNQQVEEDLDLEWFATNTTRDFPFFQKVLNIVSN